MGNSRLIKLALVLGRCKLIAGEESDAYNNGDYMDYVPYVSRFAYHALVEFRHKHYPVPKLIEFRWRFPYALTPHRLRLRVAEMLHRIDKTVRRLYVWRLNRAKCIGVRGLNWFYHCPKCGHKLFYSPRTHPCPSCVEVAEQKVVGNSQTPVVTESNHDPHTDYGDATDEENAEASWDDDYFDDWPDLEDDDEPEDDW
jgi:hypothetical protein